MGGAGERPCGGQSGIRRDTPHRGGRAGCKKTILVVPQSQGVIGTRLAPTLFLFFTGHPDEYHIRKRLARTSSEKHGTGRIGAGAAATDRNFADDGVCQACPVAGLDSTSSFLGIQFHLRSRAHRLVPILAEIACACRTSVLSGQRFRVPCPRLRGHVRPGTRRSPSMPTQAWAWHRSFVLPRGSTDESVHAPSGKRAGSVSASSCCLRGTSSGQSPPLSHR